jgi:hypothetical protein
MIFLLLILVITVPAGAVLKITKAEIIPDFPQPEGYITAKFTVKNIGDRAVPGQSSLGVEIFSSGRNGSRIAGDFVKAIPWYSNNINPLPPNASQVISAVAKLNKEGYHTASAVIISEGYTIDQLRVAEGINKKVFYVSRPADLVLESIRLNQQGRLVLGIYNAGAAIPDEHFQTAMIQVKVAAGIFTVPLGNNATKLLQKPHRRGFPGIIAERVNYIWPATGANGIVLSPTLQNKVEANIDYNQGILDNKRFNNKKTVWVGGKADLVVCFKKFNHNRPNRNAYYPPVVKNIGYARSKASKLRFWIKDDGVKTYNIPPLDPGQEYRGVQRRVYWIRVKSHRFHLIADYTNTVEEIGENNNIIEGTITVGKYGNNSPIRCSDAPGMRGWN